MKYICFILSKKAYPKIESITFFESIGRPVPMYYNPADHYLEVLDEAKRYNKNIESGILPLQTIITKFELTRNKEIANPRKICLHLFQIV